VRWPYRLSSIAVCRPKSELVPHSNRKSSTSASRSILGRSSSPIFPGLLIIGIAREDCELRREIVAEMLHHPLLVAHRVERAGRQAAGTAARRTNRYPDRFRSRAMIKLGARDLAQLIMFAYQAGLVIPRAAHRRAAGGG